FMVTPDKDYGQLVADGIFQYKPGKEGKGGKERELLGPAEVCAKYGIHSPSEVIDILAICGDTSDNVPGVKSVGEVGAGKLVGKYGSVANIYEHLDELPPKQKEAFEAAKDYIGLSLDLVTIRRDVPCEVAVESLKVPSEYGVAAAELFDYYEFSSLKKYLSAEAGLFEGAGAAKKVEVGEVGVGEIAAMAKKAGRCSVVLDCEDETIFSEIRHIYIGAAVGEECFAAVGSVADSRELLEDEGIAKTGYELKRAGNVLHNAGVELRGRLLDVELMHYVIDPERPHKLEILAKSYLGIDLGSEEGASKGKALSLFDEGDEPAEKERSVREAGVTALLGEKVAEELLASPVARLYEEMEEPLVRVLADMEREGIRVDPAQLRQVAAGLSAELEEIQQRVRTLAGEPMMNIMSTRQVGTVIFEKLALDPKMKKASEDKRYSYPTDEETLTALADRHPIVNEILEYRGVRKILSTYLEPLGNYISPMDGKIHTNFNQALTATGRLSSSKPNLQNIPVRTERGREVRRAFVLSRADGVIVSADYSQIELRIMAHMSGDEQMVRAFREGRDIHAATAATIFGIHPDEVTADQRRIAKSANFGMIYGISAFGLSKGLKISRAQAKQFIDDYFTAFPAVRRFIDGTLASAREKGYVETLFGRRRYLPDINSKNGNVRGLAERTAVNAPIQGSAADIIKMAMINVAAKISEAGLRSRMVLQIHDELVFDALLDEVEALKEIVVREMENVIRLSVPLTVDCNSGANWLETH
ncbi:MAG: DNA polymerase I, partial [Bacteroidales bacterium]|nr:DNA polymerase I [Bacteroidales bacterium]